MQSFRNSGAPETDGKATSTFSILSTSRGSMVDPSLDGLMSISVSSKKHDSWFRLDLQKQRLFFGLLGSQFRFHRAV
ncbi:MAG: uncharacterized protein KVP18_001083 [Porospora cf. gigantea A]|uniref:uncharacterized protein n=1 Tax=Porospora cf. gigantea A TaxID=2853593 RepID=UPI0035593954|nr:MAG: hypothetical protein KVP18_001083 [Porospora cf. gigantea A]